MKNLRINRLLEYWNYLNILRTNGILIFCQNLSLNALKDLQMSIYFNDLNYKWKVINKKIMKFYLKKDFIFKIKKFNYVLFIKNLTELEKMEFFLKKNEILVLGYHIENYFFFQNDFEKRNKKDIVNNLKKRFFKLYQNKINIILNMKYLIIKFILLLKNKYKYGNN